VKPGLTGLWQVLGRKDLPLRDSIEYDFYYIRNWTIWLDLQILIQTLLVVLRRRWGRLSGTGFPDKPASP
jgi:lipopolysaccharide/colanic/teichoic acid biosynthesis glycosyltransferase